MKIINIELWLQIKEQFIWQTFQSVWKFISIVMAITKYQDVISWEITLFFWQDITFENISKYKSNVKYDLQHLHTTMVDTYATKT
jgi:hypothetical protein